MKKILIVNNDPDTMQLLENLLGNAGFKTSALADINKVPEIIEQFKPNLLLLDIDQREIINRLGKTAAKKSIPVLLMTGHHNTHKYKQEGEDHIIPKPFTLQHLIEKITAITG